MRDIHLQNPLSPSFVYPGMNYKASRFKSYTSLAYRPHSNFRAPQLDRSLGFLHKIAEFKRLKEEISSIPSREVCHGFNECSTTTKAFDILQQPKIEDLEVIGYSGYVCRNCLIAHPLRTYTDKFDPVLNPIQTRHRCNMERLTEIQRHKVDKEKVLFDLYRNQLPVVMLRAVREWTENQASLKALEVSIPVDSSNVIIVSSLKRWLTRAIH